jgi:hypothetical protein
MPDAKGYAKLVIALIDRRFDSDKANIHYSSITAADSTPLEQYKIDTLFR